VIQKSFQHALLSISRIGSDPDDDDDIRLQKSLLVVCAFQFIFAGAAWGLIYLLYKEPLAGSIPLSYSFISLLSIINFGADTPISLLSFQSAHADPSVALFSDDGTGWVSQ
jgi:hypothetical protein